MGHADPVGGKNPQSPPRVIPFGKYLLLDRIAVGGMAEVYTAKSFGIEGFEKIIAIKRILPTMAEDNDFITMFIDEAKIAGHLTHANIVPIYELGKIGESHYIAMEYVWGKDLLQIMNRFRRMRRHMPPVMSAWIASKMLEGLDYAHRKRDRHGRPMGIIHRDVSPQNCLVSYEGQIKLIDFGIAKAASRNTKTQAGVLKGKFGYMSPEQVRGNPVDHRSDIFAVSTCLHEMLTGERLFVGESDFSTLEKVRNADVVPPSNVLAEMPPELEEILMKGLARDPDERWQTAGEMQEALQRFIALSRPPFGTSKLNTWMRTAFAPEIAKEKSRLDSFSKIGHPGVPAAPQPRVPALSSTSPQNPAARRPSPQKVASLDDFADMSSIADEDDDDFGGEATMITSSPFDAMQEANESLEEIAEQPTQNLLRSRRARGDSGGRLRDADPGRQPLEPGTGSAHASAASDRLSGSGAGTDGRTRLGRRCQADAAVGHVRRAARADAHAAAVAHAGVGAGHVRAAAGGHAGSESAAQPRDDGDRAPRPDGSPRQEEGRDGQADRHPRGGGGSRAGDHDRRCARPLRRRGDGHDLGQRLA